MLQKRTLVFLEQLAKNNNKAWFDAHRDEYLAVKEDFEVLVGNILTGMAKTDAAYKEINAKDCIMRIFRDVRFSKDKTPYKTNLGAGLSRGGRKFMGAGYYLHIEPGGKCFTGGGMWMPEPPMLKATRQEIDYNLKEFTGIVENKQFKKLFGKVEGEQLKKLPQGYEADNPAIEYLKMKSFTVGHNFTDAAVTTKGFEQKVTEVFAAMRPFIDFLNRAAQ
ncbi:MAG: hypothetical protein JWQ38_2779 [Flavipsychrobacter sp.]|nr:hypothetical protein [Flavipsychrobacter sp.]